MTRFRRSGHYRTSKFGVQHWVSGSVVERDDWERSAAGSSAYRAIARLGELRARTGVTSAFVNPNARCPVCGEAVFYYQNEHGSRVFFDELGPPWPKHPCTDTVPSRREAHLAQPAARPSDERSDIRRYRELDYLDAEAEFREKYERRPPHLFVVAKRIRTALGLLLILERLGNQGVRFRFCAIGRRLKYLDEGSIVSRKGAQLSFFDIGRMRPRTVEVKRIGSAKAFVAEWLSFTA